MARKNTKPPAAHDLNKPLLQLSALDVLTLHEAMKGHITVFGSVGSGKSSGHGKALAAAMVRAAARSTTAPAPVNETSDAIEPTPSDSDGDDNEQ